VQNKIILDKVSKHYPMGELTVKALDEVSLEINSGELITILGPSGAGKTTFLNVVGGIASPTSGELSVFGEELSGKSPPQLASYRQKRVGFVFQFFNLLPTLNALENVEIALQMLGSKQRVREVAEKYLSAVALDDRKTHFPSQLSGGQQQRVAIARALAKQPFTDGNLLILGDEPTGNLDEETGGVILDLIKQLCHEFKVTFLVVTHNPEISKKLEVDREIHIHNGKIVDGR